MIRGRQISVKGFSVQRKSSIVDGRWSGVDRIGEVFNLSKRNGRLPMKGKRRMMCLAMSSSTCHATSTSTSSKLSCQHPRVMPHHYLHVSQEMVDDRGLADFVNKLVVKCWCSIANDRGSTRFVGKNWFTKRSSQWLMVDDWGSGKSVSKFYSPNK